VIDGGSGEAKVRQRANTTELSGEHAITELGRQKVIKLDDLCAIPIRK